MAHCISFLLLIFGFTRIYSSSTISKVSVKAGRSLTIPCSYEDRHTDHVKYLCKGQSRISCLTVVKTNHPDDSGKFAISDDKTKRIFTVTINHLAAKDTNNYGCAVEIDFGADIYWPFTLSVNPASPTLYADHQEITGFIGDSMRTWFHSQNPGETKWCRLDRHCTTGSSSAPFGGTKVAIDENPSHNFTVTMSGLRTDSSGWYYFVKGDLQMPVHLSVTAKPSTSIYSRSTISKVSVKAGRSLTIPCSYEYRYRDHVKYFCKGPSWISCSAVVKTNHPDDSGKFAISDDKTKRIFTMTINHLAAKDTNNYWCAVEIDFGADINWPFTLSVNPASPTLYADHQEITGFIGDSMRTWFHSPNPGETNWCRLNRSCATGSSSASFGGTEVAIDENPSHNFTVTMSGLRTDSSGWYYFVKGDLQMPVHLTVTAKPSTISGNQTFSTSEQRSDILIIPRILLIFIITISLIVCFILKLHKQCKAKSSATVMVAMKDQDVTIQTD